MNSGAYSIDLQANEPRSPHIELGGVKLLARIVDKGRAAICGSLGRYEFFDCPLDRVFFEAVGASKDEFLEMLRQAYVSHLSTNALALTELRESLESKPEVSDECFLTFAEARDADNAAVLWLLDVKCTPVSVLAAINAAVDGLSAETFDDTTRIERASGKDRTMHLLTMNDGVEIFFKDWGPRDGQPIVFHHGWPLSADDWDAQMLYFVSKGYRTIAHDRRGHGRSTQSSEGHNMDRYAADALAVVEHLDLRNAVHVGHSTGGGEATRYVARYGQPEGRVAKLVLISAVPPIVVKTASNPGGLPIEIFDDIRRQLAANRTQYYYEFPIPFYGFNRPGATPSQGVILNWWRQAMMGGAKPQYDGIKAFSETDFTEDLKVIDVPALVMHSKDDQIVPFADSAPLSSKLLKNGTLKVYDSFPHGMCTTHADVINPDLLAFIKGRAEVGTTAPKAVPAHS